MIPLTTIQAANAKLAERLPSPVGVFVGATTGIGFFTLQRLAASTISPKIYFIGRSASNGAHVQKTLEEINPKGTYIFLPCDIALVKNVNECCEEILKREKEINIVWMSAGIHKPDEPDTVEGINFMAAVAYYGQMKFAVNLLPAVKAAAAKNQFTRVIRIAAGGLEKRLDPNNLDMRGSVIWTKFYHTTMITLALDNLAKQNPEISFLHAWAGLVKTEGQNFPGLFGTLVRTVMWIGGSWLLTSSEESGERNLFYATSEIYTPATKAKEVEAAIGGEGKGEGEDVALGLDGVKGSGCYTLSYNGTAKTKNAVLMEYRETGFREKTWEHTLAVWKRAEKSYQKKAGES